MDIGEVQAYCMRNLADYKVPRHILVAQSLRRAANGKADYPFITRYARDHLELK
jgi:acyl-CoA synthetase (AMP-forming)/AMP-acid ligase II